MNIVKFILRGFKKDVRAVKRDVRYRQQKPYFVRELTQAQIFAELSKARLERYVCDTELKRLKGDCKKGVDYVG